MSGKAIWTPDGIVNLGKTVDRVELRKGVMEWLRQFSDVAAALGLGMHCSKCKADIVGKNADSDRVFSVTCGCREFVGENRDYKPTVVN